MVTWCVTSAWHERDEGGLGFAGHSLEGEGRRDWGGSREVGVGGHWAKRISQ